MSVNQLERMQYTSSELLEAFANCKSRYGNDLGLALVGLHLELKERIAELEARVTELEQQRRKR